MAYADELETPDGLTLAEPRSGPIGWLASYGDNQEWSYVIRMLISDNQKLVGKALEVEEGEGPEPEAIEYQADVQAWETSFEHDIADPDFFIQVFRPGWTSAEEYLAMQLDAVRNGAALIERGEEITGRDEDDRPGMGKKPEEPMGFLDKVFWGGMTLGVMFIGVKAIGAFRSGSPNRQSPF